MIQLPPTLIFTQCPSYETYEICLMLFRTARNGLDESYIARKYHIPLTVTSYQEDTSIKATSALFPIKVRTKSRKQRPNKEPRKKNNGTNNKQRINIKRTTTIEWTAALTTGVLNYNHRNQTFSLVYVVIIYL